MSDNLSVQWLDKGREPVCAPDPAYPDGIDVDVSFNAARVCKTDLPYPAKRCGLYVVRCSICGHSVGITTAGRPDDPKSLTMACQLPESTQ